MTINFKRTLEESLTEISFQEYQEFVVHEKEEKRSLHNSCDIIEKYGQTKWKIVELINDRFNCQFDLYNWINKDKGDELAFFVNEAGSNSLNHTEFKAPYRFRVWFGERGFIVGIEQKGESFNAQKINAERIKSNQGRAFEFFRSCQNEIFFDNPNSAKMVLFQWKLKKFS